MNEKNETTERENETARALPPVMVVRWVWPMERLSVLQGSVLALGRDESLPIVLDAPGVSRRHAEFYRQGPSYVIRDLSSTNGTWRNGARVEHAPVSPGDVLRIGDWVGIVSAESVGAPAVRFDELAPGLYGGQQLADVLAPARRAAPSDVPIVLQGETGTGKERFAHAVHLFSARRGSFLAINCGAIPLHMAEAELFGYRRGAFTGAEQASEGYFRAAHEGTLFLDEVAELPLHLQAKLLRVLEDKRVLGLGQTSAVTVNVRVVAAVQKPLKKLVEQGAFRQDLAARLSGLVVNLPGLSERRGDIVPLFMRFLERYAVGRPPRVDSKLIERLCIHSWPENVRELELQTRSLLAVYGSEPILRLEHLSAPLLDCAPRQASEHVAPLPLRSRREHDLDQLKEALRRNDGSISAAAECLGISRQRIYRLLNGISPDARANTSGQWQPVDDAEVSSRAAERADVEISQHTSSSNQARPRSS